MSREVTFNLTRIEINEEACIGCGDCAMICPMSVYDIEDNLPKIVQHYYCTGCKSCEKVCPVGAIKVPEESSW